MFASTNCYEDGYYKKILLLHLRKFINTTLLDKHQYNIQNSNVMYRHHDNF
jgi:hypothetical protein